MDNRTEVAEENRAGILYKIHSVLYPGKPFLFTSWLTIIRDEAQKE